MQRLPAQPQRSCRVRFLSAALPLLAGPAAAQVTWQVVDLGVPYNRSMVADSGMVAGNYYAPPPAGGAVVAHTAVIGPNGQRIDVPDWGSLQPDFGGINAAGTVALSYVDSSFHSGAWGRWNVGGGVIFPLAAGARVTLAAINSNLLAGGTYTDASGCSAALFGYQGDVTRIGGCGAVRGLNAAGDAVGNMNDQAFLLRQGQLTWLPTPAGTLISVAYSVNDAGVAVGTAENGSGSDAMLWQGGLARSIATGGQAFAINGAGQVLGTSVACNGGFLWSPSSGMRCLADLPATRSMAGFTPDSLNAAGQMTSNGLLATPQGTMHWTGSTGASFLDAAQWDSAAGLQPSRFLDLVVAPAVAQTVQVPGRFIEGRSLKVGGGAGAVTLNLQTGSQLVTTLGTTVAGGALLTGDGSFAGGLANDGTVQLTRLVVAGGFVNRGSVTLAAPNATLQADLNNQGKLSIGAGQTLLLQRGPSAVVQPGLGVQFFAAGSQGGGSGSGSGQGWVDIPDAAIVHRNSGTLRFTGQNSRIQIAGAMRQEGLLQMTAGGNTLTVPDGLLNAGTLTTAMTLGTRIEGGVRNLAGALIQAGVPTQRLGSGANLTFAGDLTNEGEVASYGPKVVYQGWVDGNGRFSTFMAAAVHRFEGTLSPGLTLGKMDISRADVAGAVLMELGDPRTRQNDQIVFRDTLRLESTSQLQLQFVGSYVPHWGDRWDLFDYEALASPRSGNFASVLLPSLAAGLQWDLSQVYVSGYVSITQQGAGLAAPVPEPGPWLLMVGGMALLAWRRR